MDPLSIIWTTLLYSILWKVKMLQLTSALGLCDFEAISPCKSGIGCAGKSNMVGMTTWKTQDTRDTQQSADTSFQSVTLATNSPQGRPTSQQSLSPDNSASPFSNPAMENETITPSPMCPRNMELSDLSCWGTCSNPVPCSFFRAEYEYCVCPDPFVMNGDNCISTADCMCFTEWGVLVPNGSVRFDDNCVQRCECRDDQLFYSSSNYTCGEGEICDTTNGPLKHECKCANGYYGEEKECIRAHECQDIYYTRDIVNGIYKIYPYDWLADPFPVYCQVADNGEVWTVIQRRSGGSENFFRNWTSYKDGFGTLDEEFWIGNEKLFFLTNQYNVKLRIDLVTINGSLFYAEYEKFRIADESTNYTLTRIGEYNGNASAGGLPHQVGNEFFTYDRGNEPSATINCFTHTHGGWWHGNCTTNLNANFSGQGLRSLAWIGLPFGSESIVDTVMKVRQKVTSSLVKEDP